MGKFNSIAAWSQIPFTFTTQVQPIAKYTCNLEPATEREKLYMTAYNTGVPPLLCILYGTHLTLRVNLVGTKYYTKF